MISGDLCSMRVKTWVLMGILACMCCSSDFSEDINGIQKCAFNFCFWHNLSVHLQLCLLWCVWSLQQLSRLNFHCVISYSVKEQSKHQRQGRSCHTTPPKSEEILKLQCRIWALNCIYDTVPRPSGGHRLRFGYCIYPQPERINAV